MKRSDGGEAYKTPFERWYAVGVLTLIYACHALDRGLPNILVEPVRHEFNLSDSQLGVFSGLAFGLAFSAAALPMGYFTDRVRSRRNMLAGVVVVWSLMTALGGMARNYVHLILVRIGLGTAEAGTGPLIMTMLSDIFPPNRRAFALGILYTSPPIGAFVATALGGYIAAEHGWRAAFFLAGIPGLLAAMLLLFTVRDPRRGGSETEAQDADQTPVKLREAWAFLVGTPALLWLMMSCAIMGLLNITMHAWMGSFFIRVHGLGLKETGMVLGLAMAVCTFTAPPIFGWLADKFSVRNPAWALRIVWIASLVSMVATFAQLLTPVLWISIAAFVVAEVMRVGYSPPCYSVLLSKTPARMRGTVMSLVQLITSALGFGVGPIMTGALSDLFGGGAAIRYAMAAVSLLFIVSAGMLIVASRGLFGARTTGAPAPAA